MGKCLTYYNLISSLFGVLFGISAFIFFFCIHNNTRAGTWAAFSGIFAAICLQQHILYWSDRLEHYHSPQTLNTLEMLGFVVMVGGTGFMSWYIFETIYWHIPMLPIKESSTISAVWAFMTAKWGLCLMLCCKRYSKILRRHYSCLLDGK